MIHGSLFSGLDAPSVAANWMGWENAFHCEINDFCNTILKYWFPNSKHYEDITKTDFSQWRGRIDILTGGFPCQPFSVAGQRKGANDNRYLWPHMLRAIREIRPTWVIGENVAGILTMVQPGEEVEVGSQATLFGEDNRKRVLLQQEYVVETICKDLEREGYSVQPMLIPACAVGAPHRRDRVWFVARRLQDDCNEARERDNCGHGRLRFSESMGLEGEQCGENTITNTNSNGHISRTPCEGIEGSWRRYISQPCKRRNPSEWSDGLHGFPRTSSNAQCPGSGQVHQEIQPEKPDGDSADRNGYEWHATNSNSERLQIFNISQRNDAEKRKIEERCLEQYSSDVRRALHSTFWDDFPTQSPVCRGNDGLPFNVDDLTIPFTKWRQESVKGYGNAIVPQVILEIFKAIEEIEQLE